jgi:hypothetical protein
MTLPPFALVAGGTSSVQCAANYNCPRPHSGAASVCLIRDRSQEKSVCDDALSALRSALWAEINPPAHLAARPYRPHALPLSAVAIQPMKPDRRRALEDACPVPASSKSPRCGSPRRGGRRSQRRRHRFRMRPRALRGQRLCQSVSLPTWAVPPGKWLEFARRALQHCDAI